MTPLHWRIASRLHKSIDSSFQPKNHGHGAINLLAIKIKYIKFMNKFCQPRRQSPVKKASTIYLFDIWMTNDENVAKHEMVDDASSPGTTTAKARALAEAWEPQKGIGFPVAA